MCWNISRRRNLEEASVPWTGVYPVILYTWFLHYFFFLADWLFYLLTSVEPHFCLKRRARCPHGHVYSFTIIIFSITNASSSHIRWACTPPLSLFAEKNWSIYAYALKRFFLAYMHWNVHQLHKASACQCLAKCPFWLMSIHYLPPPVKSMSAEMGLLTSSWSIQRLMAAGESGKMVAVRSCKWDSFPISLKLTPIR